MNDPSYSISAAGAAAGTASSSIGTMSATRINIGYTGTAAASCADQYILEPILWLSALGTSDQNKLASYQPATFGVA